MGSKSINILTVRGSRDELMKFHNSFTKDGSFSSKSISLNKLRTVPEKLLGNEEKRDDWCKDNWGEKYNDDFLCEEIIDNEESILYQFITKYSPLSWIDYVSEELFPNLEFELEFDDYIQDINGEGIYVWCSKWWNVTN